MKLTAFTAGADEVLVVILVIGELIWVEGEDFPREKVHTLRMPLTLLADKGGDEVSNPSPGRHKKHVMCDV